MKASKCGSSGLLTISGKPAYSHRRDRIYRECELANFFRQFEIGDDFEPDRISAERNHGVLTLRLPN